jgi:hypothetical protein
VVLEKGGNNSDRSCKKRIQRVKEERDILHTIKGREDNWIGQILRRNCLLKHIAGKIQGRIDVTGRRERRRKKLLDNLKEKRGYCKLKGKH